MKTTKYIFAFALTFVILIIAKDSFCQLINLGIKGGLNLSDVSYELSPDDVQTDNRTGFNITVFYDALNFKYVILSGEAAYTQKGFKQEVTIFNELGEQTGTETINSLLSYVEFAALAKLIMRTKTMQPYITAGPVMGIYAGHSTSSSGDLDTALNNAYNTLFEELSSVTFGLEAGAGVEIQKIIPKAAIILEARYNFDLTNSYDQNNVTFKNKLWEFNLGIKF